MSDHGRPVTTFAGDRLGGPANTAIKKLFGRRDSCCGILVVDHDVLKRLHGFGRSLQSQRLNIRRGGLEPGKPTGGAMPLVWAHAEFLKLLYARKEKRPLELLTCVEAHMRRKPKAGTWHWCIDAPFDVLSRSVDRHGCALPPSRRV
jgi:hypothetical protein